MIVISGCPRSGTSMMTFLTFKLLEKEGFEIYGTKFPRDSRMERIANRQKLDQGESQKQFDLRQYLDKNFSRIEQKEEAITKIHSDTKDMNPNGFWECRYTVGGCSWHFGIEENTGEKKICKIVSQGLPRTDPKYIDKMIYMTRNPFKVAKSQERLIRGGLDKILSQDKRFKVHDPKMFIDVSRDAANYFLKTGIDPLVVDYDDVIENPSREIKRIIEYLGKGNLEDALSVVDVKLNRSKIVESDLEEEVFKEALGIYENIKLKKFKESLKVRIRANVDRSRSFNCVRVELMTNSDHCKECKLTSSFRQGLRVEAESRGIKWQERPCVYECGYDIEREDHLSVDDSIKNNFWKYKDEN